MTLVEKALAAPRNLTMDEIRGLLADSDAAKWRGVFAAAQAVKAKCGKTEVLPRGLIECSNVCAKNCLYCGIRSGNQNLSRYRISEAEAAKLIEEARRRGYPAVAFQAGEIESEENTAYYERLLAKCRGLEVTLSLGEQTEAVYRRWKAAGAMRYLIRIETSNRELYAQIHPSVCSFDRRVECIRTLKRLKYVTGTGVMIGLPGQTTDDLARDIIFFGEEKVDMVGMGPYIPHPDAPLSARGRSFSDDEVMDLSLKMIALTRLYLWDVNIVSATALEVLDRENGRARGLAAGANVVMPNLTSAEHRELYDLYPGKGLNML